jgi:hypothetical protein
MAYFADGVQLTPQGIAFNTKILASAAPFRVTAFGSIDGGGAGIFAYQEAETDRYMLRRIRAGAA